MLINSNSCNALLSTPNHLTNKKTTDTKLKKKPSLVNVYHDLKERKRRRKKNQFDWRDIYIKYDDICECEIGSQPIK